MNFRKRLISADKAKIFVACAILIGFSVNNGIFGNFIAIAVINVSIVRTVWNESLDVIGIAFHSRRLLCLGIEGPEKSFKFELIVAVKRSGGDLLFFAKGDVRVIRAARCPMVVGSEIEIFAVVCLEYGGNVNGDNGVGKIGVHILYCLVTA